MKSILITLLIVFSLASSINNEENTFKLVVFEGSDWCSNCLKFEKNILQDPLVIDFLKEEKIQIIRVDFPQRKKISQEQEKINKQYADKYQFKGTFPTVILSRADTQLFNELSSSHLTPAEFITQVKRIQNKL